VITSTATTLCAFFPMLFWPGIMGGFMSYLPKTLIVTLSASLLVALIVNPTLCAVFMRVRPETMHRGASRKDSRFMAAYEKFLRFSLRHYIVTLVLAVGSLVLITFLYFVYGRGILFFPEIESNRAMVNVKAPRGTTLETTDGIAKQVEKEAACCENIDFVIADVGTGGSGVFVGGGSSRSDAARVSIYFREWGERVEKSSATIEHIRRRIATIVGAEVNVAEEQHGPPRGEPVNIEISGEDFTVLAHLAARFRDAIKDIHGVVDLKDDYDPGQPEIRIIVDKETASLLGISTSDVAGVVRTAVSGVKAGVFREEDEEYDIVVRLPRRERVNLDTIRNMTISDRAGRQVPLSSIAAITMSSGLGSIRRIEQERVVTVTSDIKGRLSEEVRREVQETVGKIILPAGYRINYAGENVEQDKANRFLRQAFMVALLLITLVLVTQFNSVAIPFIVLFTVVLSLVGVFFGLLVTATPFGIIMTGIGVISLAGVVVNNSIVLLDYIQKTRARGLAVLEALVLSGKVRLRPVLLTAVTTIFGLLPMATGVNLDFKNLALEVGSESSQWWSSLAVAVIFGLAFATVLTLVVVPTLYQALYGWREKTAAEPLLMETDDS
jgi:multidrug efflux pump subunit AcrB